jgi:predicted aspartyl protease
MPIAYFPSLEQADTLDIVFAKPSGGDVPLRLLVDSGFTGRSCFVLPENAVDLEHAPATDSQLVGALHGSQKRSVVAGGIPALSPQFEALAILTDISSLALPAGVQGIVGLRFLRQLRRWGAEQIDDASWRFFLEIDFT